LLNSADPDQPAHLSHLIRIYTVNFLIHSVISDQEENGVDPNQTAQMCQLIWFFTVHTYQGYRYVTKIASDLQIKLC
jgi:hypothetical protein